MTNMDGVKISVNNEEEKSQDFESEKSGQEALVRKKRPGRKKIEKPEREEVSNKSDRKPKEKGGLAQTAISIALTAAVVGGGIYFWQSHSAGKDIEKISAEARSSKEEFEKRLENLKEKLSGTEKEKEGLLAEKKDLEEKTALLKEAKKQYVNNDLGLSFMYPALFGELSFEFTPKASGTVFVGKFSKNDKLVISGVSADYMREGTSSIFAFAENQGFVDQKNKYYFAAPGKKETGNFEIQPVKIIGFRGGEALVLSKKSFVGQDEFTKNSGKPFVDIGENAGALFNLKKGKYAGAAFINMDFGLLPMADFEEMLKTIEVK